MSYNKDYAFIKQCVDWFVQNGVEPEKITVEVTPLYHVVLYGSRGLTRRPAMQIIHRTRYGGKTSREERAQAAHKRYSAVLADVIKIDAAVKQLERP